MGRFESVLMMVAGEASGDIGGALQKAADAHRDPEFELLLDDKRAELAACSPHALVVRAGDVGVDTELARFIVVESTAQIEANEELRLHRYHERRKALTARADEYEWETSPLAGARPCPFCGGEPEGALTSAFWVECSDCGASSGGGGDDPAAALVDWNRRAA